MKCQQCWDHRCIKARCKCLCHEEYDKELAKNAKKQKEYQILEKEQKEFFERERKRKAIERIVKRKRS